MLVDVDSLYTLWSLLCLATNCTPICGKDWQEHDENLKRFQEGLLRWQITTMMTTRKACYL